MKKGLVVGVAVGGLLYVMWRRRRGAEAPSEPQVAWQPPPPPAPVAEEPVAAEEVTEEIELEDPEVGEPGDEAAAAEDEVVQSAAPVAPARRAEPTLHHPGRHLPLTSSGFASKPRAAAFRSPDRPQAAQARISWPGTGGPSGQRPKPLRLVPARARPSALRRSR